MLSATTDVSTHLRMCGYALAIICHKKDCCNSRRCPYRAGVCAMGSRVSRRWFFFLLPRHMRFLTVLSTTAQSGWALRVTRMHPRAIKCLCSPDSGRMAVLQLIAAFTDAGRVTVEFVVVGNAVRYELNIWSFEEALAMLDELCEADW